MSRLAALGALILLTVAPACAGDSAGAQFFLLEEGTRQDGLAGAGSALDADADAMWGNPAGLAALEEAQLFGGGFVRPVSDGTVGLSQAGLALPFQRLKLRWAFGAAASYMTLGVPGFDAGGAKSAASTENNLSLRLAAAVRRDPWAFGLRVKRLTTRLDAATRTRELRALAVDVGARATASERLELGAELRHLGPKTDGFAPPSEVRAGLAWKVFTGGRTFLVADPVYRLAAKAFSASAGVEFRLERFALRLGGRLSDTSGGAAVWTPAFGADAVNGPFRIGLAVGFLGSTVDAFASRGQISYTFSPPRLRGRGRPDPLASYGLPRERRGRLLNPAVPTVAVFEFDRVNLVAKNKRGVDTKIAERFRRRLAGSRGVRIMTAKGMEARLGPNKSMGSPCARGDAGCFQVIGAELGVTRVVVGELLVGDNVFRLRADLIQTNPYRVLSTQDISGTAMSDVRRAASTIAQMFELKLTGASR